MDETLLLMTLLTADWVDVKAMVAPKVPNVLLDVVFKTVDAEIRLTGKAHSFQDVSDEIFSLAIYKHIQDGWWKKNHLGKTEWAPRDLGAEWASQGLAAILTAPREAHFYARHWPDSISVTTASIFDRSKAIQFTKETLAGSKLTVVFAASDNYPCAIEIGTTPDRCAKLLGGLELVQYSKEFPRG